MNSLLRPAQAAATPERGAFLNDVLDGLGRSPKSIASKYFYDARGSALFEQICKQPEYYLTRDELALMQTHAKDIATALGAGVRLIEYGSGSGIKTRLLLDHLIEPTAYVPVEISSSALADSVERLGERFPDVEMLPVCADFTRALPVLHEEHPAAPSVVYFPGSTLGNFEPERAVELLAKMRRESDLALIGVDLVKDSAVLEAAYNDAAGVTAAFTLNLLERINRELGADFVLASFSHRARFDAVSERIETHIVSRVAQSVHVAGRQFEFSADESMRVEISCKYTKESFGRLAARAGWSIDHEWTDTAARFGLYLLVPRRASTPGAG